MLTTLRNAWKITDLRKKILFTLLIVLLYRIGNVIPVPFVNVEQMSLMFEEQLSGTILGFLNMMSGNAFSMATIFALSIHQKFAVQFLFACGRVSCKCNACAAVIAHVAKYHHLHRYSRAP